MDSNSVESKIKALNLNSDLENVSMPLNDSLSCNRLQDCKPEDWEKRFKCALTQLERERDDRAFSRTCLFCKEHFYGNRTVLLSHLVERHNFHIGAPDNIVFVGEFLDTLEEMLKNLQCFYCEKVFKDWGTLKEHMRKKQHKRINPYNKAFDRFYLINYLAFGKSWSDIKDEIEDLPEVMWMEENDEKDMDVMEWKEDKLSFVCLFCKKELLKFDFILQHMMAEHHFDFESLKMNYHLDFYKQVKLVNYIRKKVFINECMVCNLHCSSNEQLLKHMAESDHFTMMPDPKEWDQAMFYFPTYENDNFLCVLEEDEDIQSEAIIYPEDTIVQTDDGVRKLLV